MSHSSPKPLITIFGAGSIGCYLGGRLREGGARVRFIGRPRYQDQLAKNGLTLSRFDQDPLILNVVDFQSTPAALSGSDVIALCVKSQDTDEAVQQIAAHAPDAWVISFQNGISNLEILKTGLPKAKISGAVVPFNVTSPEPGRFHQGTDGPFIIGPDAPEAMQAALTASNTPFEIVDDIDGFLWAKLLVNLNNALNTLSGGPLRDGLLQRGYRRVLIAMIEEGLRVAGAEGVEVATFNGRHPKQLIALMRKPDWLYRFLMDRIAKIDRTARSSMLDDLDVGRANELAFLQGEIVQRANKRGLRAPVNKAVMAATEAAFAQKKSPRMTGRQMQKAFLGEGT